MSGNSLLFTSDFRSALAMKTAFQSDFPCPHGCFTHPGIQVDNWTAWQYPELWEFVLKTFLKMANRRFAIMFSIWENHAC